MANTLSDSESRELAELLQDASSGWLYDELIRVCCTVPGAYAVVKADAAGNSGRTESLTDARLFKLWHLAEVIIDQANEYGGVDWREEEQAYEFLEEAQKFADGSSQEERHGVIERAMRQYGYNNSGFNDELLEFCYALCSGDDDWRFLITQLELYPSDWNRSKIMEILRVIGDDDQYLGMRLKDLQTGYDYLDIVQYYEDKHNHELAVAYAEEGMEKGDGWANGLAEYLIGHYASKKDSESLARIMTACEQQLPRFRFEAAASIFAYFRSEGDYSSARKYLLKQADYAEGTFLKGIYDLMEGFLHEEDFAKAATGFLARLRQGNTTGYLEVLIKRGEYETALQAMKEAARPDYRWYGMQDYEHAAKTLEPHFPEALIEYYFSFMLYLVEAGAGKDRRNYKQAVFYLERAKSVYTDVLKDPVRWQNKLAEIREMFKTRRAFLEEARSVD